MRCAQFLSLLAVCPGFASRLGSKPDNNTTAITTENFPLKEADLTTENRAYCKKCANKQFNDVDHWFFYSWKIAVVAGEKRLIARCAPKLPEPSAGFTATSSASETLRRCDGDIYKIPEASDVKGVNFELSTASDRCVDILPACEECAKKEKDFFWKAVGEGSKREIYTECVVAATDFVMSGGWERSPPTQISGRFGHFFQANKDWCEKTFKDDCGAPQASAEQEKGGTNHQETGGTNHQVKNPEASSDGRGLFFWLKLFGVLVVVVVVAAAGLYLGCAKKADEDGSTD